MLTRTTPSQIAYNWRADRPPPASVHLPANQQNKLARDHNKITSTSSNKAVIQLAIAREALEKGLYFRRREIPFLVCNHDIGLH